MTYTGEVVGGKRVRRRFTFTGSKKDATAAFAVWTIENSSKPLQPTGLTVATWLTRYLAESSPNWAATTRVTNRAVANHLIRVLGSHPLASLTPPVISTALASIRTHGVGDRTVEACWQFLRAAYNRAVDYELVLASPMKRVPRPKVPPREARSFDAGQVALFFESLAGDPLYPIVVTAIFSGLRRSELCGLKWSDINWQAQTITVRRSVHRVGSETITASPKSKKARVIPVPMLLLETLLEHKKATTPEDMTVGELVDYDERYVFGTTEPFDPWSLSSKFSIVMQRISAETSLPVIRLHDCRRTFASLLVSENLGAKHISEALGHHSPSYSLEVYADILNTPVSDATTRIDEKMRRLLGQ